MPNRADPKFESPPRHWNGVVVAVDVSSLGVVVPVEVRSSSSVGVGVEVEVGSEGESTAGA